MTATVNEILERGIREMHQRQQAIAKMALDAARARYVEVWHPHPSGINRLVRIGGLM